MRTQTPQTECAHTRMLANSGLTRGRRMAGEASRRPGEPDHEARSAYRDRTPCLVPPVVLRLMLDTLAPVDA